DVPLPVGEPPKPGCRADPQHAIAILEDRRDALMNQSGTLNVRSALAADPASAHACPDGAVARGGDRPDEVLWQAIGRRVRDEPAVPKLDQTAAVGTGPERPGGIDGERQNDRRLERRFGAPIEQRERHAVEADEPGLCREPEIAFGRLRDGADGVLPQTLA